MLKSLELFNLVPPTIYLYCDSFVDKEIKNVKYNGIIKTKIELNKYSGISRKEMETTPVILKHDGVEYELNLFTEFVLLKLEAIRWALTETQSGVYFSDTDICYFAPLPNIKNTKYKVLLSPHYIKPDYEAKFGFFNAGFLWLCDKEVLDMWFKASMTSTFFEQKSLETVSEYFKEKDSILYADMNVNYGWWRLFDGRKPVGDQIKEWNRRLPGFLNSGIYVKGKPLQSVHTHFFDTTYQIGAFNKYLFSLFNEYQYYPIIALLATLKNIVESSKQTA